MAAPQTSSRLQLLQEHVTGRGRACTAMVTPSKFPVPSSVSVNSRSSWIIQEFAGSTSTSASFDNLVRFQRRQLQEKEQKLLQLYDQQQQRAHQVALRGSAGSNDSNGSSHGSIISNPTGKVRQMFDDRRQNSTRGIDKSYPLDPLDGKTRKQAVGNQRSLGTKRATRTDAGVGSQHRDGVSRESHASSHVVYRESTIQRENVSRDSYVSSRGNETAERSIGQEINIDEVIDNEAMQRNRLLAKFNPADLERRSQLDIVGRGQYLEDVIDATPDKANRKISPVERLKNWSPKKVDATAGMKKTVASTGANTRQSTLMKMTKSASLKIRKLSRNRKTLEDRKTRIHASNEAKKNSTKRNISKKSVERCDRGKNLSTLNALRSTPLICELIRNKNKNIRSSDATNLMGKVKTIIIKMESIATEIKNRANASSKFANNAEMPETISSQMKKHNEQSESPLSPSTKRPSIIDSDECKINANEAVKVSLDKKVKEPANSTDGKDENDGPTSQRDAKVLAIHGQKEPSVEPPTDHQEITIADHMIKIDKKDESGKREQDNPPRSSDGCVDRARRASFELKRMMFERHQNHEQFPPRGDSLESAPQQYQQYTTSTEVGPTDTSSKRGFESTNVTKAEDSSRSALRLRAKNSLESNTESKGFERHTSAWSMKTLKGKAPNHPKGLANEAVARGGRTLPKRKVGAALKMSTSAKLSGARDSIELTRLFVKARSLSCKRKIARDPECVDSPRDARLDNDEASAVKTQSFLPNDRVIRLESIIVDDSVPKIETFPFSTSKNSAADSNTKKADSRGADVKGKKSGAPYTSARSPEDAFEQKGRPPVKSTSLKFLNHIVDANGMAQKSNDSVIDGLDSTSAPLKDEKPASSMTQPSRASPSLSSNSNMGMNRNQAPSSNRSSNKARPVVALTTPAQRLSGSLKNANNSDGSLVRCKICNRRFSTERIVLHEDICTKTAQKKRKQFDTVTHRVKGTELESFVKCPMNKKQSKVTRSKPEPELSKSNWRRKHEEFINTIRSAKQVQAHLDGGGKLSDLPPTPPSDNSDYVQCPHCSRRFNHGAASRHIPKCNNMQHNKLAPVKSKR